MSASRSNSLAVAVALLAACGLERVTPPSTALIDDSPGGQLDTTFGSQGRILEALGATRDDAWDTALLPDGGVVLAGNSFTPTSIDVGIMKLTPNGGDDPDFGASLTGTVTVPSAGDENTCGVSVIDNKIITAGSRGTFPYFSSVYVARFDFNGQLDGSFGDAGVFVANVSADIVTTGAHSVGQEFVCQTFDDGSGGLKVAGHARFDDAGGRDVITMRLVGGNLDTTYGDQGVARVDLGGDDRLWRGSYQDANGRIPMCVVQGDPDGARQIVVARVAADGTLDTTFAGTGKITFPDAKPNYECHGIVVDDDGRVLVAGFEPGGNGDMFLRRFSDDGIVDLTFGDGGLLLIDVAGGSDAANDLAIDARGRIIVAGHATIAGQQDMAVVRLLEDGSFDPTFGHGGIVTVDVGQQARSDIANSVEIDPRGRIVAVGTSIISDGVTARDVFSGIRLSP